jgi:hypothetical protein
MPTLILVPLGWMKTGPETEVFSREAGVALFHVFLKQPYVFLKHIFSHQTASLPFLPSSLAPFLFSSRLLSCRRRMSPGRSKLAPLFLYSLALLLPSCNPDPYSLEPFDLSPYGIPISIMAPDSAVVQVKAYEQIRDITVRKHDRFNLQIFEFSPSFNDAKGEKRRQLATVRDSPHFKQILLEEDHGFIYITQPDSMTTRYDFRYIRMVGDKELIFQAGLVGAYSLDDVKRMYEAVK